MTESTDQPKSCRLPSVFVYSGILLLLAAVPIGLCGALLYWRATWWQMLACGLGSTLLSTVVGIVSVSVGIFFDGPQRK